MSPIQGNCQKPLKVFFRNRDLDQTKILLRLAEMYDDVNKYFSNSKKSVNKTVLNSCP